MAPMVTAGFRCPPEMWPTADTMTAMARPWARAIVIRPAPVPPPLVKKVAAATEPAPMKIRVKVPTNSARSFAPIPSAGWPPRCSHRSMATVRPWNPTGSRTASLMVPSFLFSSLCRLLGSAAVEALGDPGSEVGVDAAPVLDGPGQHRLHHARFDVHDDVVDQTLTGGVVEHLAHEGAGLDEVVVVAAWLVGRPHDLAGDPPGRVGAEELRLGDRATVGVRCVGRIGRVLVAHEAVAVVGVHRRPGAVDGELLGG